MSPFMKKKRPGMGDELEEPDPLDMSMTATPRKPPSVAKTTVAVASEAPPYRPTKSLGPEGGEEDYSANFGQKLADDIDNVMAAQGMEQSEGRALAANLFGAVSDCLAKAAGGGGEEAAPMEEEATEEY